jgi:bifunctional non-homologous end joining protein LigD
LEADCSQTVSTASWLLGGPSFFNARFDCGCLLKYLDMTVRKAFSFEPMLCEGVESPPEGRRWQYELKLDGFRALGRKSGRSTQLWSSNHKDFTHRFAGVAKALLELPRETVIDGEIVALDQEGKPANSDEMRAEPDFGPNYTR